MADAPKWADVERYALEQISIAHRQLEVIQPDATTNQLRGEIRAFRRVLKLAESPAPPDPKKKVQPDTPEL